MLTTIKAILEEVAADQGLHFLFSSFKEINPGIEDFNLNNGSAILVNSSITSKQKKTQGNAIDQNYFLHIACVRKRQVEDKDVDVFTTIAACESDFVTYLNAVSQDPRLNDDLGEMGLDTIYFDASIPVAGIQSKIHMKTFCQQ